MAIPQLQKIYRERARKIGLMHDLNIDIFNLARCWTRGNKNIHWLFAAMNLIFQMHQLKALNLNGVNQLEISKHRFWDKLPAP